jgi:hypothetical protein
VTPDQDITVRLTALTRAIEAWEPNSDFIHPTNRQEIRTDRVLATARKFEAYLRGDTQENPDA